MNWKLMVVDLAIGGVKKFFGHFSLDDLRGLIVSLIDNNLSGAEKRARVMEVFFKSTEGWRQYAAAALIELILAQAAMRQAKSE